MSSDKYPARLGDYVLEIQDIEDEFEKAIAEYEFPYRDGALLEDMGQKARTIRFRCYFYGSEAAYETHKQLLNDLEKQDLWELVHPKYGLLKGCIGHISVRHDDSELTAEVDISFIENLRGLIEPIEYPEVESSAEDSFVEGQEEQQAEIADDMRELIGLEAGPLLEVELDLDVPFLEQLSAASLKAQEFLRRVSTFITAVDGTLAMITQPTDSLLAMIDYASDLPGLITASIARCAERYAVLYEPLKASPASYISGMIVALGGLSDLTTDAALQKHITIAAAQRCCLELAYIYKEDEENRNTVRKAEKTKSFDLLGTYVRPTAAGPIMTIGEIEQTLAETRALIQEAVDLSRTLLSLKHLARDLFVHVNKIKIEREKLITVDIEQGMPLHLICLKYGLPYNYAERIQSINRIPNPSFTEGEIRIYAR